MKKLKLFLSFLIVVSFSLFMSCDHNDDPIQPGPDVPPGPDPTPVTHVYVAGNTSYSFFSGPAVCWEDGVLHTLDANAYEAARAVCVKGDDVYYGGSDADGHPVLWKNGTAQVLANDYGCVTDLTVANGKLYASGKVNDMPVYWVDGQMVSLDTDPNSYNGYTTTAIFVNGNDVYVSGFSGNEFNSGQGAYLWKNGTLQKLSNNASEACDVCVYNNVVYVVGSESYTSGGIQKSVMWVNGAIRDVQVTTNNGLSSKATAVTIVDGKPYVVLEGWIGSAYDGAYNGFAWYNEQVTRLYNCDRPKDVFVHNNDIYIAGASCQYSHNPALLKNLSKVTLNSGTNGYGSCFSVFVK